MTHDVYYLVWWLERKLQLLISVAFDYYTARTSLRLRKLFIVYSKG